MDGWDHLVRDGGYEESLEWDMDNEFFFSHNLTGMCSNLEK